MRRSTLVPLVAAFFAAFAAPAAARAQAVEGRLVDAHGEPVEQVLVALVDTTGRQVGAALTGAEGAFHIRAPGVGRYALRAERIGYGTVRSGSFDLRAGETHAEQMVASGAPVTLQALTVTPQARECAIRPRAGVATATLWEEARKALNATAFAQGAHVFHYDVVRWTRELNPRDLSVVSENRTAFSGAADRPFASAPADELGRDGYVRRLPGDTLLFIAPDADVLLSDTFLNGHCFRVARDGDDTTLVGLEFEPARGVRVPDVHGVLWLDRATAELRRLEYAYSGGPPQAHAEGVGGTVGFERMAHGPWIVRRWAIRMPVLGTSAVRLGSYSDFATHVLALREEGGEVVAARVDPAAGEELTAAPAAGYVTGVAWDSTRNAPLAGARVFLSGTSAEATTGADGRYRLQAPAAGRYTVALADTTLGPMAAAATHPSIDVRAGESVAADLGLPSARAAVRTACGDGALHPFAGAVTGRVRGVTGDSLRVEVSWSRYEIVRGRSVAGTNARNEARPDAAGFYLVCGVPEHRAVYVGLRSGPKLLSGAELEVSGLARHDFAPGP